MKHLTHFLHTFRKVSANEQFEMFSDINKGSYPREPFDLKVIEFSEIKHSLVQFFSNLDESPFKAGIFPVIQPGYYATEIKIG